MACRLFREVCALTDRCSERIAYFRCSSRLCGIGCALFEPAIFDLVTSGSSSRTTKSSAFRRTGNYDLSISEALQAQRMDPHQVMPYGNLAFAYRDLSRFDESKQVMARAESLGMSPWYFHEMFWRDGILHQGRSRRGAMNNHYEQHVWGRGAACAFLSCFLAWSVAGA